MVIHLPVEYFLVLAIMTKAAINMSFCGAMHSCLSVYIQKWNCLVTCFSSKSSLALIDTAEHFSKVF